MINREPMEVTHCPAKKKFCNPGSVNILPNPNMILMTLRTLYDSVPWDFVTGKVKYCTIEDTTDRRKSSKISETADGYKSV